MPVKVISTDQSINGLVKQLAKAIKSRNRSNTSSVNFICSVEG